MKRIISAASAVCLLSLTGCGTPPASTDGGANLGAAVGTIIGALPTSVQTKAAQLCGYEVPLATIASIIATFAGSKASNGTAFATTIANGICSTVTAPANNGLGLLDTASAPVYRGVPLNGRFVRK